MAPSHMDYTLNAQQNNSNIAYTQTDCYKHKKFGKRSGKDDTPTVQTTPLFRPYALSENTPRKRRQEHTDQQQQQQQQHHLPPTPPTTPPQQQHPQQQFYVPIATPPATITPFFNHQAYSFVLQKQRTVLQMRHMLSINPDANTWPAELRNALYSMLQQ